MLMAGYKLQISNNAGSKDFHYWFFNKEMLYREMS